MKTKSIRFENVNFMYDNNDKFTLKNINLEIKKNSICGIAGRSGSGKSTIVDILLGLLNQQEKFYLMKKLLIIKPYLIIKFLDMCPKIFI